jgi:CDP-glucose 4,6-dehydratase
VAIRSSALEEVVERMSKRPDSYFWKGKRVLLTGHTGFKGAWLAIWLHQLGAITQGFALEPETPRSLFDQADVTNLCRHAVGDLRDVNQVNRVVTDFQPDIAFHLGAQALVRRSYAQPVETFATNVMGTAHVLEALRHCSSIQSIVAITTDKVYRNAETGHAFVESDCLGGHDPYSASKAAAEMVIESYRQSFLASSGVGLISARAGNVIGGGDDAPDRLIPDAIRAWSQGETLSIRNPSSVRPWQHVVEPLAAYLCAAQALYEDPSTAGAYNFGPAAISCVPVGQVIELAKKAYGHTAHVQVLEQATQLHEAQLLRLDVDKAKDSLGIDPVWPVATSVTQTINWYKTVASGQSQARDACLRDIEAFCASCA